MLAAVAAIPGPSGAVAPALRTGAPEPPGIYAELRSAQLAPAGRLVGAALQVDRARFVFEDGELYLLQEVAGLSTGALYLGKGRFELEPVDAIERHQIDKFLDRPAIDLEFKWLLLRFTDDTATRLQALTKASRKPDLRKASKLFQSRRDKMLNDSLIDVDSRIVQGLLDARHDPRGASERPYFLAEIDAKGGFIFELDSFNMEEIRVYKPHGKRRRWDIWTSFHRLEDYSDPVSSSGARPPERERWAPAATVPDIAVDLAIDGNGRIEAIAELRVRALRELATVRLAISPILEVDSVSWIPGPVAEDWPLTDWADSDASPSEPHAPQGEPVPFLQVHIGRGLDEDRWEPRITVILPRTLAAGEELVLEVRYHGDLLEKLVNRDYFNRDTTGWYPQHMHARRSRFQTVFRTPDKYRVATGGVLQEERVIDGTRIERRRVGSPVVGMGFQFGKLDADRYQEPGSTPITIYSSPNTTGFAPGNRKQVLEDIRGATALYSQYYGPAPFDSLTLTETPALGGQSFAGFLLLSFNTFGGMHTGEAELFRTHELAHQWWGNSVSWTSYHDQWMSEGFAQYSAALHRLITRREEKEFTKMLAAWRLDVLGKGSIGQRFGMRHYGFSPQSLRKSDGPDSGPVWIGFRLASDKTPNDYRVIAYEKGAYVLHMLRMLLYDWEHDDDQRFRDLMRQFHLAHRGGHASTEDFLAAVQDAFDEPMDWFFDQWVYGTDIPDYKPELNFERDASGWHLRGRIRQRKVADDFRMPVPIRIQFKDRDPIVLRVMVDSPEVAVDLPLDGMPYRLQFNPLHSVLTR